uniref:Uncharacterized protein n=1 Tax=Mesocestoides corti TaxID=53468 RepID=A0A5K3G1A7_MESCO
MPKNRDIEAYSTTYSTLNDRRQMHPPSQYFLNQQVVVQCQQVYTQQALSETSN